MAAVWARSRAELRVRWRATVLLAVLVGLTGGVVLAAVAGARRTDSAIDRLVAYNSPPLDSPAGWPRAGPVTPVVERLPQVADAERVRWCRWCWPRRRDPPTRTGTGVVAAWVTIHGAVGS